MKPDEFAKIVSVDGHVAGAAEPMQLIAHERLAQFKQWGNQELTDLHWLAILAEEFGESSKEVVELEAIEKERKRRMQMIEHGIRFSEEDLNKKKAELETKLETELVQTGAVVVSWLEARARRKKAKQPLDGICGCDDIRTSHVNDSGPCIISGCECPGFKQKENHDD